MEKPIYSFQSSGNQEGYTFTSTSANKRITKVVDFEQFEGMPDFIHFSFGDLLSNGKVDFNGVSNNQDMELVLGTVI